MKEAVFQEPRETCKAVMNGSWMGWRGQSFKNIQLLYPNSPVFSLAENIKRCYGCSLDFDYSYVSINDPY